MADTALALAVLGGFYGTAFIITMILNRDKDDQ